MNEKTIQIDSTILGEKAEALNPIFKMYIEDINPFIVNFEISSGEFPAEVQNEIRAIYGHLVRATMAETPEVAERNIEKMKSHSKRALLDCFKYTSIIYSDKYDSFMKRYEGIDLTYLEQGQFLPNVVNQCKKARTDLKNAKIAETTNISEEKLFDLYQGAYQEFEKLNDMLEQTEEDAAFLQNKATRKELVSKISLWVGIGGLIVGVLGILVAVI